MKFLLNQVGQTNICATKSDVIVWTRPEYVSNRLRTGHMYTCTHVHMMHDVWTSRVWVDQLLFVSFSLSRHVPFLLSGSLSSLFTFAPSLSARRQTCRYKPTSWSILPLTCPFGKARHLLSSDDGIPRYGSGPKDVRVIPPLSLYLMLSHVVLSLPDFLLDTGHLITTKKTPFLLEKLYKQRRTAPDTGSAGSCGWVLLGQG